MLCLVVARRAWLECSSKRFIVNPEIASAALAGSDPRDRVILRRRGVEWWHFSDGLALEQLGLFHLIHRTHTYFNIIFVDLYRASSDG